MDSVELYSLLNSVYPAATSDADSARAQEYVNEVVAVAYHGTARARLDSLAAADSALAWFFAPPPATNGYWTFSKLLNAFDPIAAWRQVRVPVLLLYGAEDRRVPPAESAARISSALHAAGNNHVTVKIFPGADHTFRLPPGPGGWPGSAPGYLSTLIDWVVKR